MEMSHSGYLDVSFSELAELKQVSGSFVRNICSSICSEINLEIQHGLYHRYEEREKNLTLLKGKCC